MSGLYNILGIDENCDYKDILNKKFKNSKEEYSFKVLRDRFYSKVYKKYRDLDVLENAGFILDKLCDNNLNFYNLNFLTTPFSKIIRNLEKNDIKNPVVLLTTGGFDPLHDGHIEMMELAKKKLEEVGYDIVGGYFSPSHDDYVLNKPFNCRISSQRIKDCREIVDDSDWLMIDPWEATYVSTYINFTDVINRLELYLKKYVRDDIKVAYVFGGDNAKFMYCFEEDGIGVCIERDNFNDVYYEMKDKIFSNNCYFVDNKSINSNLSSRDFRKEKTNNSNDKISGIYAIRDEGVLPLANCINVTNENKVCKSQKVFLDKFVELLKNNLDKNIFIKTINIDNQLNDSYELLNNKKTISLDNYFKGTYNIEISRLFDISDYQKRRIKMIPRPYYDDLSVQISKIDNGSYILVDDDSATGATINGVMSLLPSDIKINSIYLLANYLNDDIYDVIDFRDFIVGSLDSGLVVELPNGDVVRAPYLLPYVSLYTRASIPVDKEKMMSLDVWKMNKDFYTSINPNIKLKDMDICFIKLMKYIGFKEDDLIIDIINWHIDNLK